MQNVIEKQIVIRAPQARIYEAITNPEEVVKWFPETLEGRYEVGEQPIFGFGDHGRNQLYIVEAKPHDYFAFRWVPGAAHFLGDVLSVPNTLVEFRIADLGDGSCRLTLTETGFGELPAEMMASAFEQNSGGWSFMLGRLEARFAD